MVLAVMEAYGFSGEVGFKGIFRPRERWLLVGHDEGCLFVVFERRCRAFAPGGLYYSVCGYCARLITDKLLNSGFSFLNLEKSFSAVPALRDDGRLLQASSTPYPNR
jgi:hypothetical protein